MYSDRSFHSVIEVMNAPLICKIFPNPVLNHLNIGFNSDQKISAEIFDIYGRRLINVSGYNLCINFDKHNPGIYLVKISTDDSIIKRRILKIK